MRWFDPAVQGGEKGEKERRKNSEASSEEKKIPCPAGQVKWEESVED